MQYGTDTKYENEKTTEKATKKIIQVRFKFSNLLYSALFCVVSEVFTIMFINVSQIFK